MATTGRVGRVFEPSRPSKSGSFLWKSPVRGALRESASDHMGTAALGCPVERSSTGVCRDSGALLRRTAEGGCPHVVRGGFLHERGASAHIELRRYNAFCGSVFQASC